MHGALAAVGSHAVCFACVSQHARCDTVAALPRTTQIINNSEFEKHTYSLHRAHMLKYFKRVFCVPLAAAHVHLCVCVCVIGDIFTNVCI